MPQTREKRTGAFNRFAQRKDDWGLARTLYWYVMAAADKVLGLRLHYVFVGPTFANMQPVELPPGYSNRQVQLHELDAYAGRLPELDEAFLHGARERGDLCVGSFYGGELVGFSFLTSTRVRATDKLDVVVPTGFTYSYKSWTQPQHRRASLAGSRLFVMNQVHGNRLPALFYIETHNYPSLLRSYRPPREQRMHMGYIGWFGWFGRQFPFASRRAKWIGMEFVPRGAVYERFYS